MNRFFFLTILSLMVTACQQTASSDSSTKKEMNLGEAILQNGLSLSPIELEETEEAVLKPIEKETQIKEHVISIAFQSDLYDESLGIRFGLNNGPIGAFQKNANIPILEGNNVLLAYLVNPNGISLKSESAFYCKNHYTLEGAGDFDAQAPHLFYLSPDGRLSTSEGPLILDFYLLNTELSAGGNQLKLSIDTTEFLLNYWTAYALEGLSQGQHSIRMQLVDANGDLIPGPFNDSGDRWVEVVE